jgi:hypothetical protein
MNKMAPARCASFSVSSVLSSPSIKPVPFLPSIPLIVIFGTTSTSDSFDRRRALRSLGLPRILRDVLDQHHVLGRRELLLLARGDVGHDQRIHLELGHAAAEAQLGPVGRASRRRVDDS